MDRDRAFATIVLELGVSTREHVEQALAAREQGDERPLGKILLANGWLDEPGYLKAMDAQRAREAFAQANAPTPERVDLERKRRAARAAVQKGALVAEAAANAPFLRKIVGKPLGRVLLGRLIHKGQMALTLSGLLDRRNVRVKILRPDMAHNARALARFDRESAALARVDHPCVARVLDHGVQELPDGLTVRWFATESDEGKTLAECLEAEQVLDPERVAALGRDIAHGLAAAHRVGVIHRDVRPETVFITRAGNVRIFDFGLARDEDSTENLTFKGQILGAAEYAAPELALGPAIPASDVYSLGVTLYQCLTGELPYGSRSVVRLLALHTTAPVPWANKVRIDVPRPLAAVVRALMAKKPEERPSMHDVAFKLSEPGVLALDDLEPDECTGCGADVWISIDDSNVPVCEECVAQVASGKRCGGCLHAITSGFPYAGRTYCSTCIARLGSLSHRPPPGTGS